ncbi:MAG: glycogen synthase GlgA [Myxococcales bacterium]|nr:glycogen synthase GlgA [Myxococcales bacterium]MCB9642402.1 glycogen synthase GlgA [Myxococcales bacterium]
MVEQRKSSLRILMVAAEIAPWAKVGGLGDVIAALPGALTRQGAEVVLAVPRYLCLREPLTPVRALHRYPFRMSWGAHSSYNLRLFEAQHPDGFKVLLIDCPQLFDRAGIYNAPGSSHDYADSLVRWTALCRGALFGALLLGGEWDVVHAHDMHAALALPLLREEHRATPLSHARAVLSIHNLAYQGLYPLSSVNDIGLSEEMAGPFGAYEFYGQMNMMKAALSFADGIHTVSPTYAYEIVEDESFGHGLQGVLWSRRHHVMGILNGIDSRIWDPATQPALPAHYDVDDLKGKEACRRALQEELGWDVNDKRPILGMVTRLTSQKGVDLVAECVPMLIQQDARLVVLGTGDPRIEATLRALMEKHPSHIQARFLFDQALAHRILAGVDICLMPSLFEPCGLVQMYAMRYGTLPIVRRTGGLADTVEMVDTEQLTGTGFLFEDPTSLALARVIRQALSLWRQRPRWLEILKNAMRKDFSWDHMAQDYINWYEELLV